MIKDTQILLCQCILSDELIATDLHAKAIMVGRRILCIRVGTFFLSLPPLNCSFDLFLVFHCRSISWPLGKFKTIDQLWQRGTNNPIFITIYIFFISTQVHTDNLPFSCLFFFDILVRLLISIRPDSIFLFVYWSFWIIYFCSDCASENEMRT